MGLWTNLSDITAVCLAGTSSGYAYIGKSATADGKIIHTENRLLSAKMVGVAIPMVGGDGINLVARVYSNGLIEPRRLPSGVTEGFRSEVYVFYGTAKQIQTEVDRLEVSGR